MHASLFEWGQSARRTSESKGTDTLGIKDQAAGTLFMIFGQVDLQCIFVRFLSMNNTILLVEV